MSGFLFVFLAVEPFSQMKLCMEPQEVGLAWVSVESVKP